MRPSPLNKPHTTTHLHGYAIHSITTSTQLNSFHINYLLTKTTRKNTILLVNPKQPPLLLRPHTHPHSLQLSPSQAPASASAHTSTARPYQKASPPKSFAPNPETRPSKSSSPTKTSSRTIPSARSRSCRRSTHHASLYSRHSGTKSSALCSLSLTCRSRSQTSLIKAAAAAAATQH